jgi:DNA-binding SARP family transcriptional activator
MIILHTLGTASIEIEGSIVITPTGAPRRFAALLYLALERGREISREQLIGLLFPEQSPTRGAHSLREVIYVLRHAAVPLISSLHGFTLESKEVWSDFETALHAHTISDDALRAMAGGFLPSFNPQGGDEYADWLDGARAAATGHLTRKVLVQLERAMRAGRWEAGERAARACIGLDPWNERATFALAEILAVGGSRANALQLLDDYIAEIGPRSTELATRAGVLRRRINEGPAYRDGGPSDIESPRLVGRELEMAALVDAFERARSGDSQCVVVAGEAGIGKTRLVSDFSAAAVIRRAHVARVVIQPHDGDRPMGAFVDLVPALLEAPGALGSSPSAFAALNNLTGKHSSDDPPPPNRISGAEEHEQRWTAVSRAVVDLCEAIANERTLVLVIEDAHWLDTLSANTIGRIVGTRRNARIMVVATTRDARPLVRQMRLTERCQTLSIPPLSVPAVRELLDIALPGRRRVREPAQSDSAASLKKDIAAVSAGNPLFLLSLAAHSRAHRGPFRVPGTIVETFAQRIDALSRRAMSVLATCAELGKHSTIDRLVRAAEMKQHELVESLLELSDAGLVLRDELNAVPTHPLVSDALLSRLPLPARRAVAHAVAAILEADAEAGPSPALWWDVAASWQVADNPQQAIAALKRCADHALEMGRPGEAARLLEQAAVFPQPTEQLAELGSALVRSASEAGEFGLVLRGSELRRAAVLDHRHDELEIAELHAFLSISQYELHAAQRLPDCIRASGATSAHRVEAAIVLLKCADMTGRPDLRDIAIRETAAEDIASVADFIRLEFQMLVASTLGDRHQAANIGRALIERFRRLENEQSTPLRYCHSGIIALQLAGMDAEAIRDYEHLIELAERRGSYRCQHIAAVQLASIHFDIGNDSEADAWIARALAVADERPEFASDFNLTTTRMEMALFRGQFETAATLATSLVPSQSGKTANAINVDRWRNACSVAVRTGRDELRFADRAHLLALGTRQVRSMTGIRDLEVAVTVKALHRLGCDEDAFGIITSYMASERTVCRRPSRLLAQAIEMAARSEQGNSASAMVPHAARLSRATLGHSLPATDLAPTIES